MNNGIGMSENKKEYIKLYNGELYVSEESLDYLKRFNGGFKKIEYVGELFNPMWKFEKYLKESNEKSHLLTVNKDIFENISFTIAPHQEEEEEEISDCCVINLPKNN